jgi:ribonuclease HI
VSISQLPKEDAALEHNRSQQHLGAKDVTIYSDASAISDDKSTGVGVGLVVFNHRSNAPKIVYRGMSNLGHSQLVYNGELEGTTQAIEYASHVAQPGQHFHIFSDNQAGLHRLRTPSDQPGQACQIRAIAATELCSRKGAKVSLNWVPGHTDVYGNELADSLAKEATTLTPVSDETSFATLGCKINELRTLEWHTVLAQYDQIPNTNTTSYKKHFWWKLGSKLQLPTGTRRELASAFYQLKLGHGYIKSYLFRLGHSDSDRCQCGKKETSEHLLLSCRKLQTARAKLQDELRGTRLSLRLLLHTKTGIEKTLAFLKETRIVTRKWHLERTLEEEEEWDRVWN